MTPTILSPQLTARPWIGPTVAPHSCFSQGFFLLQWSLSVLLPGFAAQPTVLQPPPQHPHSLYTCFPRPCCSLQERKLNAAFSQESDSCYMHLVHGTKSLYHSFKGLIFVGIYKSVNYFLSLRSDQAISSMDEGMSSIFCSPSQSQLLERCLAYHAVPSHFHCGCATLWPTACQALLSMGFSRQEY